MNKVFLIISREYFSRVRKPAFLVMTILGPVLMAALFIVPVYFSLKEQKKYNVAVVDKLGKTERKEFKLGGSKIISYHYGYNTVQDASEELKKGTRDVIIYIPENVLQIPQIEIYYKVQPGFIAVDIMRGDVQHMRNRVLYDEFGINLEAMDTLKLHGSIQVVNKVVGDDGKVTEKDSKVSWIIGFGGAMVMYMFIFIYGVQVMRGVMEEKTNRIVEVIVSSVRPFQLMMGKIIGVALVGLTQFCLWILLTLLLVSVGQATLLKDVKITDPTSVKEDPMRKLKMGENVSGFSVKENVNAQGQVSKMFEDVLQRNIYFYLAIFLFYFLGGYLLYSALFAAVGSAVDAETDAQQFMLPVTAPIIFSIVMAQVVMNNPEGSLATWLSIIPFTSPVVMMVRLPFITPGWDLVLSMIMLVLGFIFTTWLAGRIYRTGILMYGKKVTWRELWKWLFYKA
jgi:ABC-2 type transport system permease protein